MLRLTFLTTCRLTNPSASSNPFYLREMKRRKAEQRVSSQITSFQSQTRLLDLKCWYLNYHIALQMSVAWLVDSAGLKLVHLTLLSCVCLFSTRKAHNLFNGCLWQRSTEGCLNCFKSCPDTRNTNSTQLFFPQMQTRRRVCDSLRVSFAVCQWKFSSWKLEVGFHIPAI